MHRCTAFVTALTLIVTLATAARADRLKELVTVDGFRTNQLTGFGLVVGLDGTGDYTRSPITRRALTKMLKRLGLAVSDAQIQARNVAAVIVTAELPPFARPGSTIDVTVSSMDSADSLQGGTLVATPLKGADARTYAIAQGPMSVGGFTATGASGSSKRKNHVTAGRIPGGATIEVGAPTRLPDKQIVLALRSPDFTTATRIAAAIDASLGEGTARVRDPGAVLVTVSDKWRKREVQLVATLEAIEAIPDAPARVIIDERTGTVVVGDHVVLGKAAIAHGGITIEISEGLSASQPGILSSGDTVLTPDTKVEVTEATGDLHVLAPATTVGDIASALNALGAKPRDLVSIFQALAAAGALRAEVQVL